MVVLVTGLIGAVAVGLLMESAWGLTTAVVATGLSAGLLSRSRKVAWIPLALALCTAVALEVIPDSSTGVDLGFGYTLLFMLLYGLIGGVAVLVGVAIGRRRRPPEEDPTWTNVTA